MNTPVHVHLYTTCVCVCVVLSCPPSMHQCAESSDVQEQLRRAGEEVKKNERLQQDKQQRDSKRLQDEQDSLQRQRQQLEDDTHTHTQTHTH